MVVPCPDGKDGNVAECKNFKFMKRGPIKKLSVSVLKCAIFKAFYGLIWTHQSQQVPCIVIVKSFLTSCLSARDTCAPALSCAQCSGHPCRTRETVILIV